VIDPIDGTKAFVCGVRYSDAAGARREREAVVGVIDLPAFVTRCMPRGRWAVVDGTPAHVSGIDRIEEAALLDGCSTTMEILGYEEPWKRLRRRAKLARVGVTATPLPSRYRTRRVMVDPVAAVWDVAPLAVILPEQVGVHVAGGTSRSPRTAVFDERSSPRGIVSEFAPYLKRTAH